MLNGARRLWWQLPVVESRTLLIYTTSIASMGEYFVTGKLPKALRALAFVFFFVTISKRETSNIPVMRIAWWQDHLVGRNGCTGMGPSS